MDESPVERYIREMNLKKEEEPTPAKEARRLVEQAFGLGSSRDGETSRRAAPGGGGRKIKWLDDERRKGGHAPRPAKRKGAAQGSNSRGTGKDGTKEKSAVPKHDADDERTETAAAAETAEEHAGHGLGPSIYGSEIGRTPPGGRSPAVHGRESLGWISPASWFSSPAALLNAMVFSELMAPPVSMREAERRPAAATHAAAEREDED